LEFETAFFVYNRNLLSDYNLDKFSIAEQNRFLPQTIYTSWLMIVMEAHATGYTKDVMKMGYWYSKQPHTLSQHANIF